MIDMNLPQLIEKVNAAAQSLITFRSNEFSYIRGPFFGSINVEVDFKKIANFLESNKHTIKST